MTTQPGWFPDPLQRFEARYWDGHSWTAHVSNSGKQDVDPAGISASVSSTAVPEGVLPQRSPFPPPTPVRDPTGIPEHLNVVSFAAVAEVPDTVSFFWPRFNWSSSLVEPRLGPTEDLKATYQLDAMVTLLVQDGHSQWGQVAIRSGPSPSSGQLFLTSLQIAGGITGDRSFAGFAIPHDLVAAIGFQRPAKNTLLLRIAMKQHGGGGLLGVQLSLALEDKLQKWAIKAIRDWTVVGIGENRPWRIANERVREFCVSLLDKPIPDPSKNWQTVPYSPLVNLDFTLGTPEAHAFRTPAPDVLALFWKDRPAPPTPPPPSPVPPELNGFWPDPYSERRMRLHYEGQWTRHLIDRFRTQPELPDLPLILARERAARSWDDYDIGRHRWVDEELYASAPLSASSALIGRFDVRGFCTSPFPLDPDDCYALVSYATSKTLVSRDSREVVHNFDPAGWLLLTELGLNVFAKQPPLPPDDPVSGRLRLAGFLDRVESFEEWTAPDSALAKLGDRLTSRRSNEESQDLHRLVDTAGDALWRVEQSTVWDVRWDSLKRWRLLELAVPRHFILEFDLHCEAPRGEYMTRGRLFGEVPVELALEGLADRFSKAVPGAVVDSTLGRRIFGGGVDRAASAYRPVLLWTQ